VEKISAAADRLFAQAHAKGVYTSAWDSVQKLYAGDQWDIGTRELNDKIIEFTSQYPSTWKDAFMVENERIKIRDGYTNAGKVGKYVSKSIEDSDAVVVEFDGKRRKVLYEAIAVHPYTREERILRLIGDYADLLGTLGFDIELMEDDVAALYAVIDAGIDNSNVMS
jgi:hypothetical protein